MVTSTAHHEGRRWCTFTVDVDSAEHLWAATDGGPVGVADGAATAAQGQPWAAIGLAGVAVSCPVAAGVLFAIDWTWGPPPRLQALPAGESCPPAVLAGGECWPARANDAYAMESSAPGTGSALATGIPTMPNEASGTADTVDNPPLELIELLEHSNPLSTNVIG